MAKAERWTTTAILLNFGGFVLTILLGTFALYLHNTVLPYIYFFYAVAMYAGYLYFNCTRCEYYGHLCNMAGGWIAEKLRLPMRSTSAMDPDDSFIEVFYLVVVLSPLPFLLYYQDWMMLIIFGMIGIGWIFFHNLSACTRCKNAVCPLNPDNVKRGTAGRRGLSGLWDYIFSGK